MNTSPRFHPGAHSNRRHTNRPLALWMCLSAILLLSSCVNVSWFRDRSHAPISEKATQSFTPGQTNMQDCLNKLGAPILVIPGALDSLDLLWVWNDKASWEISVSFNIISRVSTSVRYSSTDASMDALRLRFDKNFVLTQARRGQIRDLVQPKGL